MKVVAKAIDIHGHFGRYERPGGGLESLIMSADIETVRRRAQAADICLTVVSALHAFFPAGGDVLRANEDACRVAEEYPDICFWTVINPTISETYCQAARLLVHPRCKGIKIHPTEHAYDIRDYGDEIFTFAANRDATILSHSGCKGSLPDDLIHFAHSYSSVQLILAHLGNSLDGNLARQVHGVKASRNGNVYIDTSSAKSINSGLIEWAVSEVGAHHLLFGSDTPLYFAASQKARIEYAEIDEKAKQAILFGNAAQLLQEHRI